MQRQRNPAHRGFTLMEIILVVLIIGIMSSLAIPYYLHMSGRASRSEAQVVLGKLRVYFINLYENQGTFLTGTQAVGYLSAANPSNTSIPIGQPATWEPNAAGWTDFPFPPEGAIRLRYMYQITAPNALTLIACGNFPGFGAAIYACGNGLVGNYLYQEFYQGPTALTPIEFPSAF
jgi:prepilin-type N-terminal cleavage/methylation domain-containing protein